jgi:hypothetical protein
MHCACSLPVRRRHRSLRYSPFQNTPLRCRQLDIASPHPALPILPILNGCAAPDKYLVLLLVYLRMCCGKVAGNKGKDEEGDASMA